MSLFNKFWIIRASVTFNTNIFLSNLRFLYLRIHDIEKKIIQGQDMYFLKVAKIFLTEIKKMHFQNDKNCFFYFLESKKIIFFT